MKRLVLVFAAILLTGILSIQAQDVWEASSYTIKKGTVYTYNGEYLACTFTVKAKMGSEVNVDHVLINGQYAPLIKIKENPALTRYLVKLPMTSKFPIGKDFNAKIFLDLGQGMIQPMAISESSDGDDGEDGGPGGPGGGDPTVVVIKYP